MTIIAFPLRHPQQAQAAREAQARNMSVLYPAEPPPIPLSGTVFDLVRGRHLSVIGAQAGTGGRITFYSLFCPHTGLTVIRTPDQIRALSLTPPEPAA
jgi:hypothetical protein